MLARNPLTGYLHYVPDQYLQGWDAGDELSDGLGFPIAPLLAGLIPAIPQLLGGLFGGGGNRPAEAPAAAPSAAMAAPSIPVPIPVPQMMPIPVPIPIPIPMSFRRWAGGDARAPAVAIAGAVPLRSHARRRRR